MNNALTKTLTAGLMHGLKFKYCCPYDHNSDRIGIVNEVDMTAQCFSDETGSRYKFGHPTVRLFLFPMSALTKEIEFVLKTFDVNMVYHIKWAESFNGWEKFISKLSFEVVEYLISQHFNVFNLSPEEFIEVNETNNPY